MTFIETINNRIQHEMRMAATNDPRVLSGLRVIKSEYDLAISKNKNMDDIDIIKKLAKIRQETAKGYEGINENLRAQELIELNILTPFIPEEPKEEDVIAFLNTLNIKKEMKNFKKLQEECKTEFAQNVGTGIIRDWIRGSIA